MASEPNYKSTLFITLGGTITGLGNALLANDVLRTCYLAAVGALVSFLVTVILKKVFGKWMK